MATNNEQKRELWNRRETNLELFKYEGMPATKLPSARAFLRDASLKEQKAILNLLHAKSLSELWERMETPDFFTLNTATVLCYHGWDPYDLGVSLSRKVRKYHPNTDPADDGGWAVAREPKAKKGPVLGE